MRAAERASTAARMALGLEAGELEVATLLSFTVGILPGAIVRWQASYPEMRVRMIEYTHRAVLEEQVRDGAGDIALGPKPGSWTGPVESLGYEELVVILPHSDPLAGRRSVKLEALADRLWILFQPGHGLTDVVDTACNTAGFQPRVGVRTAQVAAAVNLAAAGLGPAMVPDNVIPPGLDASVAHLDPPLVRELAAYTRSEWSPLAATFLESLRQGKWRRHQGLDAIAI